MTSPLRPEAALPVMSARCSWYDEDEEGVPIGEPCGKPATHYSCNHGGSAGAVNACAGHKCRCAKPTADLLGPTDSVLALIEVCAKLCDREARICGDQENAAKGFAKSIHVGGGCIARSLAVQIRALAGRFTRVEPESKVAPTTDEDI